MARRQHKNSISLFPFLAVLVCTMGALILLLLVTTRKIRNDQLQGQRDVAGVSGAAGPSSVMIGPGDRADEAAELDELTQLVTARREQLRRKKVRLDELQAVVNSRKTSAERLRTETTALQQELSSMQTASKNESLVSLQQQSNTLNTELTELQGQLDQTTAHLLKKQQQLYTTKQKAAQSSLSLHEKRSALVSLRKQVKLAKEEKHLASAGTQTLLEFSNPTGTTRTPIVIDVTNTGFEFLPTGIHITARDMEGFPVKDNPLLSAVLTLHRQRSHDSVVSEPYVLLLVRPDGCLAFYSAQRVLTEAKIHYGYELLNPGRTISSGTPDEKEIQQVRSAILETLTRRETMYAALQDELNSRVRGPDRASEGSSRRLIVRSDGRVMAADANDDRPVEGRFFAGGEALPRDFVRSIPRTPSGRPGVPFTGPTEQRPSGTGPDGLPNTSSIPGHRPSADGTASPSSPPADVRDRSGDTANRTPSSASDPSTPRGSGATPSEADPLVSSAVGQSAGTIYERPDAQAAAQKSASGASAPDWQPRSLIRESPNWSSAKSSAADTTQPLNSDESLLSQWMGADDDGTSDSKAGAGSVSGTLYPGKAASMKHIDPELAALLNSQKPFSRDSATPVGVTVFLDARNMTIGQQPTIPVSPDTLPNAFAKLLLAVSEEVAAVRTTPDEPLMPVVKFVVSPGGEQLRIPLARELRKLGIASASVVEITPYISPFDEEPDDSDDDFGRASVKNTPKNKAAAEEPPQAQKSQSTRTSSFGKTTQPNPAARSTKSGQPQLRRKR